MAKYLLAVLMAAVFYNTAVRAENIALPSCDDKALLTLVGEMIDTYQEKNPATTLTDKRKYLLTQKNLKTFEPVTIAGFAPKTDYNVANRILMSKINEGLKESEMQLCKSSSRQLDRTVYIFMKPYEGKVWIELVNFLPKADADKNFYSIMQ